MCTEKPRAQARHAVARAAANMALGVPLVATHDAPIRFLGLRHSWHAHCQQIKMSYLRTCADHLYTKCIDTDMATA